MQYITSFLNVITFLISFIGINMSGGGMGLHQSQHQYGYGQPGSHQYDPNSLGMGARFQQQRDEEFTIQNEDFPALPG